MDPDVILLIGIVVGCLSIPSLMGAIADGRVPRVGAIAITLAGAMIAFAVYQKPGGYVLSDVPDVIAGLVGSYFN